MRLFEVFHVVHVGEGYGPVLFQIAGGHSRSVVEVATFEILFFIDANLLHILNVDRPVKLDHARLHDLRGIAAIRHIRIVFVIFLFIKYLRDSFTRQRVNT